MRFTKRNTFILIFTLLIVYFLTTYQMPYYIQKPGMADTLDPIVEVNGGYDSEGEMHLLTVSGMQATPLQYALALVLPHNEIQPLEEMFPEGVSEEDYFHAQLQFMESSQEASLVVAYEAADREIEVDYIGVYVVSVIEGMPSEGKIEMGDRIIAIDDVEITEADDLIDYVETKEAGDILTVQYVRDDTQEMTEVTLDYFDDEEDRVGLGISLVTDREINVEPEVAFSSGNIGGPSAGLMFSLEIFDQLTEEDITKGYKIAGTGEIDYNGDVYRVGGVDKKVVAADREGIDILFAPHEDGEVESNYEIAVEKGEEIGTDMEIVPVSHFEDAIEFLQDYPEK